MAKRATATTERWTEATKWREDDALAALSAWAESGESMARFARSRGIAAQRLSRWKRHLELRSGGAAAAAETGAFVPVKLRGTEGIAIGAPLMVTLADGTRIEVRELDAGTAAWVAALLRARAESQP
jgi:hypothetical protein